MTTAPAVNLGDIVRAVNKGDKPVTFQWDSKRYVLEPGKDAFIPFEAAKLYLGDPRAGGSVASLRNEQGIVAFVPDRATEVRRLRTLHGEVMGDETTFNKDHVGYPRVEVFTLDGDKITTVLDDPEGTEVTAYTPSVADQSQLMAIVQRQQRHIDMLMERFQNEQATVEPPSGQNVNESSSVPSDTPDKAQTPDEAPDEPELMHDGLPPEDHNQ